MKNKIRTVSTLFFAVFGGTLILKYLFYKTILGTDFNVAENINEQAFIALFVAILLTFANGLSINWNNQEKQT